MIGVFGEVMIELQPHGKGVFRRGVAGDTFNTAVMLSRLGSDVSYFTALGDDGFSDNIRQACEHHGLPLSSIITLPGVSPGMYAIENDSKGERTFTYWRSASAAKQCFSELRHFKSLIDNAQLCSAFYWSGITLALMSEDVLTHWLRFLSDQRAKGKPVFFDTNFRSNLWQGGEDIARAYDRALSVADYFLPSEEDLSAIYRFSHQDDIEAFCASLSCHTLMSSHKKAYYWSSEKSCVLPLEFSDSMVDATGAGDAFSGGFIHGINQHCSVEDAIRIAHKCASHVVQFKGAILPDSQWERLGLKEVYNVV